MGVMKLPPNKYLFRVKFNNTKEIHVVLFKVDNKDTSIKWCHSNVFFVNAFLVNFSFQYPRRFNGRWLERKDPSCNLLVQNQQWEHQNNEWNIIYVNNEETRTTLIEVILVLTLSRFHTLLSSFDCKLWTSKCWLGLAWDGSIFNVSA